MLYIGHSGLQHGFAFSQTLVGIQSSIRKNCLKDNFCPNFAGTSRKS